MPPGEEPLALLCSALLPTLSPRTGWAWSGWSFPAPALAPFLCRSRGFSRCCLILSLFPPRPADPLKTGSVFGAQGGSSAAQPGLLEALTLLRAQPGCARAAIPALPHPPPRAERAPVGFWGSQQSCLNPSPSSRPGPGLCPRFNPRSFPSCDAAGITFTARVWSCFLSPRAKIL